MVAAISGLRQGILGRKNFVMLITGQRLVFTEMTGNDVKELNRQAKARGDGVFGRMKAGFSASMNTGEVFKGQDVNTVIPEIPRSFGTVQLREPAEDQEPERGIQRL